MDNSTRRDLGLLYKADEPIRAEIFATRKRLFDYNHTDYTDIPSLVAQIGHILGSHGENVFITPPFFCDYGTHIHVGENFFANYNLTVLDVGKVTIGQNAFFGPNVSIYTAGHPLHHEIRNAGWEYGMPVTIGDDCWIGGNVVINAGVTIGDRVVIGSGSVVTKDISSDCVAAGNPCRVLRTISEEDRDTYFRGRVTDADVLADVAKQSE